MSRAIHKLRSLQGILILLENLGNVDDSGSQSHTFAARPVGSGSGRTIIIGCSIEEDTISGSRITGCIVDGNAAVEQISTHRAISNQVVDTAIFTLDLTSESGNVDIRMNGSESPRSWGMSYIVVRGMKSITAIDTAGGASSSSPLSTSTTLDGLAGGLTFGIVAAGNRGQVVTWGNLMTSKADLSTGSGGQSHRHSVAFDLLPGGRAAATETVSQSGVERFALSTATFR